MYVYLDLNIFDRLEKISVLKENEKPFYQDLINLIESGEIITPYSNAHLNDLFRGYQKNPNYIDGHLKNIEKLSNNLCICQYWNYSNVTWHYRNIFEFFNEKKEEWDLEADSLWELLESVGLPTFQLQLYKSVPLDKNWKKGYTDPMFGIMFPRSKKENSAYALIEDIYGFQHKLKTDYSLYKKFKTYLIHNINKLKNNKEYLKSVRENFKDLPKHLEMEDILNIHEPKNDQLNNKEYSKVLDLFFKTDLKGYKTDANYNNMFDDSLHTFYAAHCDFFITNDDRCLYKASKTYERLKIRTKVMKANELELLKNCL